MRRSIAGTIAGWMLLSLCQSGLGQAPSTIQPAGKGGEEMQFELVSSVFGSGENIPRKYTCDGEDVSPPLEWRGVPEHTRSLALIVDDPDAPVGTWDHWILFNLPASQVSLKEGFPDTAQFADGTRSGKNSWRRLGYGGPCPPSGTHRYYFRLYALDTVLDLEPGASSQQLRRAFKNSVLEHTELMGRYRRQRR